MLLKRKLTDKVDYVQASEGPDLQNFIEMTSHKYIIDNVINIVEDSKNKTAIAIIRSEMNH